MLKSRAREEGKGIAVELGAPGPVQDTCPCLGAFQVSGFSGFLRKTMETTANQKGFSGFLRKTMETTANQKSTFKGTRLLCVADTRGGGRAFPRCRDAAPVSRDIFWSFGLRAAWASGPK